jgi:hypothetical protein
MGCFTNSSIYRLCWRHKVPKVIPTCFLLTSWEGLGMVQQVLREHWWSPKVTVTNKCIIDHMDTLYIYLITWDSNRQKGLSQVWPLPPPCHYFQSSWWKYLTVFGTSRTLLPVSVNVEYFTVPQILPLSSPDHCG